MKNNQENENADIDKYLKINSTGSEEYIKENEIITHGLTNAEAIHILEIDGYNEVKQGRQKKWYNYFLQSLFTPFNSILLGIAVILSYTDVIIAETPSYANIIVIVSLVLISTLLEFIEEYRSNKSAEKLKELVATTTTVLRDGNKEKIPLKEVVVGDIVVLSAGEMIPADLKVLEAKDLYIRQSSLTGESDAIKKVANTEIKEEETETISDLDTICFMGTNVISGSGKAVVIYTGDNTYFASIAHSITSEKPKTSFQKGVENISKLLIRFMLILIPLVFLFNVWKHDLLTSFTFAVAVAIGITPLLLPVILSSSLSKGAVRMSNKKTIVKKLDSIQSFGAMNILCTDKTGTLTEDKIVLEKYLDVKGNEDIRILKYAFLNSYFQTGLKGSIDEAIIARAYKNELQKIIENYKKIDEIPFDFVRRRLSVVVNENDKKLIITKGAVEEILNICSNMDYQGEISNITKEAKENILKISKDMNKEGLRVIAVAQKIAKEEVKDFNVSDEKNMTLVGFIGFLDPPKESAKDSIARLNKAKIRVIVLTGDNAEVTKCICEKVNINSRRIVTGAEIEKLSDPGVKRLLRNTNIFAKLSPIQKARIVRLLKESGNIVGYMGDGINDSPSLTNSDVGISVDTAVDVAKESADIILLEKDLNVLLDGVTEGRRTFCNLMKYIKMAASFNFGEVSSVIIASILLPFLPITPIQLLVQSLLYDLGQLTLPFDNVDETYLQSPRKWDIKGLKKFMIFMGPISSCFDLIVFALLWFVFKVREAAVFQTIWFSYGVVSNLVGMHIIRTSEKPFIQSNASKMVYFSSILLSIIAMIVPFTILGEIIGLVGISAKFFTVIIGVPILYCFVAIIAKKIYISKNGEWI